MRGCGEGAYFVDFAELGDALFEGERDECILGLSWGLRLRLRFWLRGWLRVRGAGHGVVGVGHCWIFHFEFVDS